MRVKGVKRYWSGELFEKEDIDPRGLTEVFLDAIAKSSYNDEDDYNLTWTVDDGTKEFPFGLFLTEMEDWTDIATIFIKCEGDDLRYLLYYEEGDQDYERSSLRGLRTTVKLKVDSTKIDLALPTIRKIVSVTAASLDGIQIEGHLEGFRNWFDDNLTFRPTKEEKRALIQKLDKVFQKTAKQRKNFLFKK